MLWGTLSETYPEFSLGLRHAILEMEQRWLVQRFATSKNHMATSVLCMA